MLLQLSGNGLDICLDLAVLGLHLLHSVGAFFEEAEKALLLFLHIEIPELGHQGCDHSADFSQIFCPDAVQSLLGKICHLFLGSHTVGHDSLRIGDIDLLDEGVHHFDLFRCEYCLFRLRLGGLLLGRSRSFLHGLGFRLSERE